METLLSRHEMRITLDDRGIAWTLFTGSGAPKIEQALWLNLRVNYYDKYIAIIISTL